MKQTFEEMARRQRQFAGGIALALPAGLFLGIVGILIYEWFKG